MNGKDPRDPREATLRRLVRDARAEPAPELDWARLEQRLLVEAGRSAAPAKRSGYPYAWGALAVAAAVVLWLFGTHPRTAVSPAPDASMEISGPLRQLADTDEVGTRYEATTREVTVRHVDRAKWTLAKGSSALLAGKGDVIRVQLERGSVLSEVVPNPKPETFVVEAAGVRVAVHGTVFRVALEGGRVLVDVREGTVGVGPLGDTPAFLLKAPAHGNFAADGRSGSIDGRWVSAGQAHPAGPPKPQPVRSSSASAPAASSGAVPVFPVASAELPSEPSINDIEAGIARIVDKTSDCFARHTQSADGVQITVHTALSLQILADGAVTNVDFQPPLSPAAEACAAASMKQVRFAASKQGTTVTRLLELKK
jgi:ferric-dicitrate binding protein FerR (iron transport regulator)